MHKYAHKVMQRSSCIASFLSPLAHEVHPTAHPVALPTACLFASFAEVESRPAVPEQQQQQLPQPLQPQPLPPAEQRLQAASMSTSQGSSQHTAGVQHTMEVGCLCAHASACVYGVGNQFQCVSRCGCGTDCL